MNNEIPLPPEPPPCRIECGYCHKVMPEPIYNEHKCSGKYFTIVTFILFSFAILASVVLIIGDFS